MTTAPKLPSDALAARFERSSLEGLESARAGPRLSTGWPALDAWLGGGWPLGGLVELRGRGRSSLALGAARQAQAAGLAVAWVDGGGGFCPATARLTLERLDLLRVPASAPDVKHAARVETDVDAGAASRAARRPPARSTLALRGADLLLRARAHALVVLDMPPGPAPAAAFFRLERLARRARCGLLLLQGHRRCLAGSASPCLLEVRLQLEPRAGLWDPGLAAPELEVRLLRQRAASGAHGHAALLLRAEDFELPAAPAPRVAPDLSRAGSEP